MPERQGSARLRAGSYTSAINGRFASNCPFACFNSLVYRHQQYRLYLLRLFHFYYIIYLFQIQ